MQILKSKAAARATVSGLLLFLVTLFSLSSAISAQIPTPKSFLGFEPADDKKVAEWQQITEYFGKLDKASPRVSVEKIGESSLGKPLIAAYISSPENIKQLTKYKQISQKLADPRTIKNDAETKALVDQGKTIVAISCSIHATEIVATQMSMTLAHQLATAQDPETLEILQNTILVLIPSSNPDGLDIVAEWYKKTLGTKSEGSTPPELYHYYAGHDNNRDWFMLNLKETQAITKLFWKEWFPQFVYDVHQQGQEGSRFTLPPFFDPPNPNIPPAILREVGLVGYKMAADLSAAGYSGIATNSSYDTWWHGGFRTAPYFHNSIGILTEAASSDLMTPVTITKERLKNARAIRGLKNPLETATNYPEAWEGGLWRPKDIANIELIAARGLLTLAAKYRARYLQNFYNLNEKAIKGKENQSAAYIIPAGQPNEENVSRMLEILMAQGVEVHRLTKELHLTLADKSHSEFPLGSFLVLLNQPQRQNVKVLFERQVYPNRINPDGQPDVPYDVAVWTLPLQMGVESMEVAKIDEAEADRKLQRIQNINEVRGQLNLKPAAGDFAKITNPIKNQKRLGLYKSWSASMDEGWTRLVLDNFQIPFKSLQDSAVKTGNLNADYDAIILPSDSERQISNGLSANRYPDEFTGGIGEKGTENLKKFVDEGGTLICFDESCELVINKFSLPMKNVLKGVKRGDFYCPGSILQLNVDTVNPLANGLRKETAAYFINSSAFEITDASKVKSIAKYPEKNALMSGWLLGEKFLNGKTALAEANYGKGKLILFGFRPQHRGQTWGTFPFIFNALEK